MERYFILVHEFFFVLLTADLFKNDLLHFRKTKYIWTLYWTLSRRQFIV